MASFILAPYLTSEQLKFWLSLSKVNHCLHMSSSVYSVKLDCVFPQVFKLCYCHSVTVNDLDYHSTVQSFVECVHASAPEMRQKVKIHLLLQVLVHHIPHCSGEKQVAVVNASVKHS